MPAEDVNRIRKLFERAGLPVKVKLNTSQRKDLFAAMRLDKKVSGGEIKFVLAKEIGKVDFGVRVPESHIIAVLDQLGEK